MNTERSELDFGDDYDPETAFQNDAALPQRVLIITDRDELRESLACSVGTHGHEVVTATNGVRGLLECLTQPFHLVVVDSGLEGMHGVELVTQLRAQNSATPVILLTGAEPVHLDDHEGVEIRMRPKCPVQLLRVTNAILDQIGYGVAVDEVPEAISIRDDDEADGTDVAHHYRNARRLSGCAPGVD